MAKTLPLARRSELRGEAHKLKPVVLIGDKGLTDEVVAEIDRSLKAHELIKVRAASGEREQRDIWLETICERLEAHPVQQIGKVFVIYRERSAEESDPGPSSGIAGLPGDDKGRRPRVGVVSDRGRQAQRTRDLEKQRLRDIADMKRKGKIPANAKLGPAPKSGPRLRGDDGRAAAGATGTSRPRSRAPSPLPESGPRRRRPRTSR